MIKLNLGCGTHKIPGWINVDSYRGEDVQPDYQGDITSKDYLKDVIAALHILAEETGWDRDKPAVDEILVSHTLEHFEWSTDPLWMWLELLKPGGRFIAVVPDTLGAAQLADVGLIGKDWFRDIVFGMDRLHPRPELQHRRVYTPSIMVKELREHGLVSVTRVIKGQARWTEMLQEGVLNSGIEEQIVCEGWKP